MGPMGCGDNRKGFNWEPIHTELRRIADEIHLILGILDQHLEAPIFRGTAVEKLPGRAGKHSLPVAFVQCFFVYSNCGWFLCPNVSHHPIIGNIISNRDLVWWCETNSQKGTWHLPTPVQLWLVMVHHQIPPRFPRGPGHHTSSGASS